MQARKIDFKAGSLAKKNEMRGKMYGKADKVGGISQGAKVLSTFT